MAAYDPNFPPCNAELTAASFRTGFNRLHHTLATQIPAIPPGQQGPPGVDVADIRNNGNGTLTVIMTDATKFGPFTLPPGPQGPPGEVSGQQLNDAIAGTSANSNSVNTLDENADQATIIAKINELIGALRR